MVADAYTAQITRDTLTSITGQYFDLEMPFAFPRYGNSCTSYTTGRDYFKAVADAIRAAKSFIMITDWQLDFDVELDNRGQPDHPGRLSELLADAIQRGVHIRIILYDSIYAAVDTHEEASQKKLSNLPKGKGSISVMVQNQNTGRDTFAADSGWLFSHHQKSVVVDGRIAFLGGLDLAYGRWDTNAFNVIIDPAIRVVNDAYNQQLVPARNLSSREIALLKEKDGRPGFRGPTGKSEKVFDEETQPRQPWQDVALQISGPATFDVFVNFVLRWNSFAGSGTNILDSGMVVDWFKQAQGEKYLIDPLQIGEGTGVVQICRSTSSAQLKDELVLWDNRHKYINDDWKKLNPKRRKLVQDARKAWAGAHQTSILDAMINCIRSAQAFIYIENQFFMSDCGFDQHGAPCPSSNQIIRELANAVGKAIYSDRPFHIWLTLPEHPEGLIEEAGTLSQAWWALQGVKRGRASLVNRINSTIIAKNASKWGLKQLPTNQTQVNEILASRGMIDEWQNYLTVLNLRNYGHTKNHVLTEMIYVHSKLLVVDDAVAIIGSANINDRSLLGKGDTELAAIVVDTTDAVLTDVGDGVKVITRKFARDLRISMWQKHLGAKIDEPSTGSKKIPVPHGIDVSRPLAKVTINRIKELARVNREAYGKIFMHTPRNTFATLGEGRQLAYPVLSVKHGTRDFSKPPTLQPPYMHNESHQVDKAGEFLRANIKGFWVEMPLNWGFAQGATPHAPLKLPEMIAADQISSDEVV